MGDALLRQWLLLSLLPKPPRRIDAATLETRLRERGHEAHRRTVQRDLVALSSVFPIEMDARGKPYGWRWAADAAVPPMRAPRLQVRLRITGDYAELGATEVVVGPEEAIVSCRIPDDDPTRRLLLALAGRVEVLEPATLRGELAGVATRAARVYAAELVHRETLAAP